MLQACLATLTGSWSRRTGLDRSTGRFGARSLEELSLADRVGTRRVSIASVGLRRQREGD